MIGASHLAMCYANAKNVDLKNISIKILTIAMNNKIL